jgi:hypothetical protein
LTFPSVIVSVGNPKLNLHSSCTCNEAFIVTTRY